MINLFALVCGKDMKVPSQYVLRNSYIYIILLIIFVFFGCIYIYIVVNNAYVWAIFTYIYHRNGLYIGKCSCHMDGMGISESSRLPV